MDDGLFTGIEEIDAQIRFAEKAYDEMYDARSAASAMACFSELKDSFSAAIALADERGLKEKAELLRRRLEHCKQVYRRQFS
ncbi:MAG: hypothetical protein JO102_03550 [Elusimicrobia bacterium]|nr:hypothetical protein [Elusimicrobiota bacterium]